MRSRQPPGLAVKSYLCRSKGRLHELQRPSRVWTWELTVTRLGKLSPGALGLGQPDSTLAE